MRTRVRFLRMLRRLLPAIAITAAITSAPHASPFSGRDTAESIGEKLKTQQAFLNRLDKYFYPAKVQAAVDSVVKVGDEFEMHREFLGLANRTSYLPYVRQFQFLYFRSGREEEGCWRMEILVNEQLQIQRVTVVQQKD